MTTYDYELRTSVDTLGQSLTVVGSDGSVHTLTPETHPTFVEILDALREGDFDEVKSMLDLHVTVEAGLTRLSDRVAVVNGQVQFGNEIMDNALSDHLIQTLREGGDYVPVVRFMERLSENPSVASRVALWAWIKANGLTLTKDGLIVAYKGVRSDLTSIHSGSEDVWVDGELHTGNIPNKIGALVKMDRDLIDEDRATYCSVGLHAGAWGYANTFGNGITLKVLVDPANVVTVPNDSGTQKMRVCEYRVVGAVNEKVATALDA